LENVITLVHFDVGNYNLIMQNLTITTHVKMVIDVKQTSKQPNSTDSV